MAPDEEAATAAVDAGRDRPSRPTMTGEHVTDGPSAGGGATAGSRGRFGVPVPQGVEATLWVVALVALVADLATTGYGLRRGLTELNPVARAAIETYGAAALGPLKGLALLVGVAGWTAMPRAHRWVVPAALAVPWLVASLLNLGVVLSR